MVVIDRWSLFVGGRLLRFDRTLEFRNYYIVVGDSSGEEGCQESGGVCNHCCHPHQGSGKVGSEFHMIDLLTWYSGIRLIFALANVTIRLLWSHFKTPELLLYFNLRSNFWTKIRIKTANILFITKFIYLITNFQCFITKSLIKKLFIHHQIQLKNHQPFYFYYHQIQCHFNQIGIENHQLYPIFQSPICYIK